jgi:hypothetical protein
VWSSRFQENRFFIPVKNEEFQNSLYVCYYTRSRERKTTRFSFSLSLSASARAYVRVCGRQTLEHRADLPTFCARSCASLWEKEKGRKKKNYLGLQNRSYDEASRRGVALHTFPRALCGRTKPKEIATSSLSQTPLLPYCRHVFFFFCASLSSLLLVRVLCTKKCR